MSKENENLKSCEICGNISSFERHNTTLPPEGEVCGVCQRWICDKCVDYHYMAQHNKVDPICKECTERIKRCK